MARTRCRSDTGTKYAYRLGVPGRRRAVTGCAVNLGGALGGFA